MPILGLKTELCVNYLSGKPLPNVWPTLEGQSFRNHSNQHKTFHPPAELAARKKTWKKQSVE
jgi:hypothetical protein